MDKEKEQLLREKEQIDNLWSEYYTALATDVCGGVSILAKRLWSDDCQQEKNAEN